MCLHAYLSTCLTATATAAPLLGTTDSFANSTFCKAYQCQLVGKQALGQTLTEFRYTVKGEFPVNMHTSPEVITVIRQNSRVISANWVSGAQDTVLYASGYNTAMMALLAEEMTGKRPSPQLLQQLNDKCEKTIGQEAFIPWPAGGKTFRLACLMSGEYANALRFSFTVYLP